MTTGGGLAPWASFWAGEDSRYSGCLPAAPASIDAIVQAHWLSFARRLARKGSVLDLATGNGIVLRKIMSVRPDLKLIGVDASPVLPPSPPGIALKAGVAMEALPFPAARFEAVTSQFGIEYGDTAAAALELGRVLRRGGHVQLVVHHKQGPIVAHNSQRRDALRWALDASGYWEKARLLSLARAGGRLPTPRSFREAIAEAGRLYKAQPVAREFLTAILHTLELGYDQPPAHALATLHTLRERAENEIARTALLEAAACDAPRLAAIVGQLAAAGVDIADPVELREIPSSPPFAWLLTGSKAAA